MEEFQKKKQLLILGLPGAGKGTQSALLANQFNLTHLSTGEVFREVVKRGDDFGKMVASLIDKGNYVPDEYLLKIVTDFTSQCKNSAGFIYDGFPRTIPQTVAFEHYLMTHSLEIDGAFFLDVSEKTIIDRLKKRAANSKREDDSSDIIEHRLEVYYELTAPVVEYFCDQEKLIRIPGEGPIHETMQMVVEAYKQLG